MEDVRIIQADGENFYIGWLVNGEQLYVNKFDENGDEVWASPIIYSVYSQSYMPFTFRLLSAPENGLYIGYINDDDEFFIQKLDINGNRLWGTEGILVDYAYTRFDSFPVFSTYQGYIYAVYSPLYDNGFNVGMSEVVKVQLLDSNGNKQFGDGISLSYDDFYLGLYAFNSTVDNLGNLLIGVNRPYDTLYPDPEWIASDWLGSEVVVYKVSLTGEFTWGMKDY